MDETTTLTLASLLFTALCVVLGMLVRITIKWTRIEDRLATVGNDLTELVKDKDKTHKEILDLIREDRKATNERLTYLERSVWPRTRRNNDGS